MGQAKSIDTQILSYLDQLSDKKKKAVLSIVKTFAEEPMPIWEAMPANVKKSVEKSIAQSEKGLGKPHKEVMQKYKQWLKK